jgi:hypothetical protein
MVPAQLFTLLRQSIRLKTAGEALMSGIREMSALRSIVFPSQPSAASLKEMPEVDFEKVTVCRNPYSESAPLPAPVPPPRVYRPRRSTSSGSSDPYAPYRLLWVKVIIRAAYDYALWKDSKDLRHRKFAEDARKWLFDSSDLEFGLSNICEIWGLPLEKIRRFARNLTKEEVKKLEFKERQGRELVPPVTATLQ